MKPHSTEHNRYKKTRIIKKDNFFMKRKLLANYQINDREWIEYDI